ncbi:MAG: glycosyltransferase family 9 protein [Rhizobacter sp.]
MSSRDASGLALGYAQATWTPPFSQTLPSNAQAYASSVSWWQVARRRAMREINLAWHGQGSWVRDVIDLSSHRRVLWIHQGTPQVGDSLMDLAARVLLQGQVERLDLLTEPHLLGLYRNDEVFTQVASSPAGLSELYDLVLLHSTSSRSLKGKLTHYRRVPFVHIQGFYTGPEFNRTLFGFYRLAQLLGSPFSETELEALARPSMRASAEDDAAIARLRLPAGAIVVALGGIRDWRTYTRWPQVLHGLYAAGVRSPVVLVGSDNALVMRDEILAAQTGLTVIDRVGQHSLGEVHALMQRGALVLCADGGLLHVAHTTGVPVVALFAGIIEPRFRITSANRTLALHGALAVDDVPADAVVSQALVAMAQPASAGRSPDRPEPQHPM